MASLASVWLPLGVQQVHLGNIALQVDNRRNVLPRVHPSKMNNADFVVRDSGLYIKPCSLVEHRERMHADPVESSGHEVRQRQATIDTDIERGLFGEMVEMTALYDCTKYVAPLRPVWAIDAHSENAAVDHR